MTELPHGWTPKSEIREAFLTEEPDSSSERLLAVPIPLAPNGHVISSRSTESKGARRERRPIRTTRRKILMDRTLEH